MDKKQAQALIKETFESPFDKNRFVGFMKNLLNKVEEATFIYKGNYIPDAYEQYINTLERIGKYSDGEHKIDILIAKLKKETSIERARTMQRNFVAWYLNGSRGGELKDAALVAFVAPNEEDWRFSLVKMDYRFEEGEKGRMRVKEEFTPARRWSFLVGANENSHTAQSQLVDLVADDERNPVLNQIEEAFNIEKVTKEFFEKYRELFLWTKETLDGVVKKDKKIRADFETKRVETVDFSKKLLGQIVFLYFLQKKGWFGVKRDDNWGTGPRNFLRELFEGKHGTYKNFFNDILEPLFYEALARERDDNFYSQFNCKIPFLNGGLFDPIKNYDWVHTDIFLPNKLFSNDFKTKEGDIGNGILDIFDRYNFTVKEDEPLEKEVAIDPELLGKAYEKFNAIRPDNYDEYEKALISGQSGAESQFNKQYGVYYTPREIVHYICQQSLINFLTTELDGKVIKEDVESLIKYGEQVTENEAAVEAKGRETDTYFYRLPESIRENAKLIDEKLTNIKVCDPAIGSGAFPVGMMSEIVKIRNVLSAYIKDSYRTSYGFKRECIEKSLYGVDIDAGAVEIAKLRLWLSLVVDEEDIKQIKPLPNLDYKIVCGNSLLGVEKNLFNSHLFAELEHLKPLLFNETAPPKKQEYKKQIDNLISQITNGHKEFDFEVFFSEIYHEKKGFDVVIANPPYITVALGKKQKFFHKDEINTLKRFFADVFEYKGNTFVFFIKKGIDLLNHRGTMSFIVPNTLLLNTTFTKIRKYITQHATVIYLINIKDKVFADVEIGGNLIIILKKTIDAKYSVATKQIEKLASFHHPLSYDYVSSEEFAKNDESKFYLNIALFGLSQKLLKNSVPLGSIVKFYQGIITGDNEKFLSQRQINSKYYKILRGRDIHKYYYSFNNTYVLFDKSLLWSNTNEELYQVKEKLINRQTGSELIAAYDDKGFFTLDSTHIQVPINRKFHIKYILALFNSRLLNFYYNQLVCEENRVFAQVKIVALKRLPIKNITESEQKIFIKLVDEILLLVKTKPCNEKKIKKQGECERQINQLVYKLYGLTDKEIKIVEGATNGEKADK